MITILIPHYNASRFLDTVLHSVQLLTDSDYRTIICDNGSSDRELKEIYQLVKYPFMLVYNQQTSAGSIGHGEAMNKLLGMVETKYAVFLESDAIFLKKGWDRIMLKELRGKVKAVGCPMPENPLRPTDFPSVFATMFDMDAFRELEIDMMPRDIYQGQDIGWEMREKFLKAGYQGLCFETRNTRTWQEGPFRDVLCTEHYFMDELMASHFGRGSTLGEAKYKGLPKWMRERMGRKEIEEWLGICRRIIDEQAR